MDDTTETAEVDLIGLSPVTSNERIARLRQRQAAVEAGVNTASQGPGVSREFRAELENLINKTGVDAAYNIPDHEIADAVCALIEGKTPPSAASIDAMVDNWTSHHPPGSPDVVAAHEKIRAAARALLITFAQTIPDCPDRTHAMRKAVEAMWAGNAAVACNHPDNHVLDLS